LPDERGGPPKSEKIKGKKARRSIKSSSPTLCTLFPFKRKVRFVEEVLRDF